MTTTDDHQDEPTTPPAGPLRDFAEALNPAGGALQIDAPFSLTAEHDTTIREQQPGLFTEKDDTP